MRRDTEGRALLVPADVFVGLDCGAQEAGVAAAGEEAVFTVPKHGMEGMLP